MSKADKRIPVTEDRFQELGDLKNAGQTWDELLGELAQARKEQNLARMIRDSKENDDFIPLREAFPEDEIEE
jgi:predicted CopG family antitoxin